MAAGGTVVLFSLAFLGYYIYRNWATLTAYHWQVDYAQLGLTLLLYLGAYVFAILGWHSIIGRLAGAHSLSLNTKAYCYGALAGRLPGVALDIATRVFLYDQVGVSKAVVGLASLLELILVALAGVAFYLALLPFTLSFGSRLGLWPLLGALALGLLLTHPRLVTYVVRRVKKDALPVSLRYQDTLRWLLVYVFAWVAGGLMAYATVRVIYALPTRYVLQVVADWSFAAVLTSFITFVPSSLGLKEVTLTLLLSRYMPGYIAVVAVILLRLLTIGYSLLWALCATRLPNPRSREMVQGQGSWQE
jgi:uncharacterized membrane protein YbhN (UPF0104 family)